MDANKLILLNHVDYKVCRCCYFCKHAEPFLAHNNWSTCRKHLYQHLKHTGEMRQMSILKFGVCRDFEFADVYQTGLGAFSQFLR